MKLFKISRSIFLSVTCLLLISGMPFKVQALPMSLIGSFDTSFGSRGTPGPEGIAFDPDSGNLFLVASNDYGLSPDTSTIVEVTTSGAFVRSFGVSLDQVEGLHILSNGNLLLSNSTSASSGGGVYEYTTDGNPVGTGLNITTDPPSADNDGAVLHTGTNTIFVADDSDEAIYEFALDGTLLNTISTTGILSAFNEPEGIDFDPLTGNLLVVDDSGGTSSLYELSTTGDLIEVHDLITLTAGATTPAGPFNDPEGIAFDPTTRTVYVAFDNDRAVGIFSLGGGPKPPVSVSEPASLLLTSLGLLALMRLSQREARQQ